jgi:hypothetical protein
MQYSAIRKHQSLKEIYETELGHSISDRTWYRVKNRLILDDTDMHRVNEVRAFAALRRENRRKFINAVTVRRAIHVDRQFPTDITADGRSLYLSICKALDRTIPESTLYRWGHEIGVPFSFRDSVWYSPEHLKIWARKILPLCKN